MSKKTPLEEAFDLPSIDEINSKFSDESIKNSEDQDEEVEDSEIDDMKDYLKELENSDWDEDDIQNPEELKKQIAQTQKKLDTLEEQKRQLKSLTKYHQDVDSIHAIAMDKFDEIMTVALTMEASAGSKYLASATKLLDIALSAKNSSMDREIEMAKLQLRKEKQDHDINKPKTKDLGYGSYSSDDDENDDEDNLEEHGEVFDRNALLRNEGKHTKK